MTYRMMKIFWIVLLTGWLGLSVRSVALDRTVSFYQNDLTQADSTSRRRAMVLDGNWQYRSGGDGEWQGIRLPAPMRLQGIFTLRKYFQIDSSMVADAYLLRFEGVDGGCVIYLNKKIVGTHLAGTAPFSLSLAKEDVFVNEENELLVDLDTRIDYRSSLPRIVRNRGIPVASDGLFRSVVLYSGQRPYLTGVGLDYEAASTIMSYTRVRIRTGVCVASEDTLGALLAAAGGAKTALRWEWEIVSINEPVALLFKSPAEMVYPRGLAEFELKGEAMVPGMQFWRPRSGQMYKVTVRLFRGLEVVDQTSLLWGLLPAAPAARDKNFPHPMKIIEWVEDSRIRQLSGEPLRERIEKDMHTIYILGADAVRVPGNLPDEYLLTVCDRLGLAVLVEVPIVNIPPRFFEQPALKQAAQSAVEEMVRAFRSHPSVLAWGLGSGYNPADPHTQKFIRELSVAAQTLDDRLLYAGVRGKYKFLPTLAVDLRILEIRPEEMADALAARNSVNEGDIYQLLTLMPALGGDTRATQQSQAFTLKKNLLELLRRPGVSGISVTPFQDWRGDAPHLYWGPRPEGEIFSAGLLDVDHKQRMAFEVVRAAFSGSKMPEMLPGESQRVDTSIFQIVGFGLILILLFFLKRDKRLNNYFRRVFVYPHGFYVDLCENRQVNVFLTALVGLSAFIALASVLASLTFHLRGNAYIDEFLTWLMPGATAKTQAIHMVWQPAGMILFYTVLLIGLAILQSLVYKMIILGQRRFLRFFQIVVLVFWVPANMIFALPLVVILYRLLEGWVFIPAATVYFSLILVWYFFRALRGVKVLLQLSTIRAFLLQTILFVVAAGILLFYLEQTQSVLSYASYYRGLLGF